MEIAVSNLDKDLLSAALFQNGCAGIEECSSHRWRIYFSNALSPSRQRSIIRNLRTMLPSLEPDSIVFSLNSWQDWNEEWKKYFRPIKVTSRIWVAPPWHLPPRRKEEICLIVDPQMAFGTGSHESTQLMIRAMEKYMPPHARVLDVGTGSGILAILARKLHARQVFACDIEPEAIENARHNADLNDVHDITFQCGELPMIFAANFDVILANINLGVLLDLIPDLANKLKPQGVLILSGILIVDEQSMLQAAVNHFMCIERFEKREWLALVLEKLP